MKNGMQQAKQASALKKLWVGVNAMNRLALSPSLLADVD